eukprot:CAMPEP_0170548434 /NCGR_PEP_ID=MMETSP0211-20121228/6764_1 /TAXON_ID=311385 /ORGANISM="Pseudokeronopsis sp., Strain OXSARD2" /LENGTH=58 /DNA_ID=CAMNT_0010854003 /DNA_START=519 /DNA_END=695 /DNA_ORIENTATION=-
MVVGGYDQNVGSFYHKQLDTLGNLDPNPKQNPKSVLKPFDQEASGTVLGDGGAFMVLE